MIYMRKMKEVNLDDIRQKLDEVKLVKIAARDIQTGKLLGLDNDNIGTANVSKSKLLHVFNSSNYSIVQHGVFLDTIEQTLGKNFRGSYYMRDDNSRLHVYAYPENMKQLIHNKKTGENEWINFGIRMSNSYDGSRALKVSSIGYQEICDNGMWAQTFVPRSYQKHTKNANIKQFRQGIENLQEAKYDDIIMVYEKATEKIVPSVPVLLQETFGNRRKSLQQDIQSKLKGKENPTIWDVYTTATESITHGFREEKGQLKTSDHYTDSTLKGLHKSANKLLTINLHEIDWSKDITLVAEK